MDWCGSSTPKTLKYAVATNTILNKKGQNVICVYVVIGQKTSSVVQVVNTFKERGAIFAHFKMWDGAFLVF